MPEISRFYGIRITMNYAEHLPPHFHASYGEDEAQILIETGQMLGVPYPNGRPAWFASGPCFIATN